MITRIDHVAIAVPEFPAALSQYTSMLGQPPLAASGTLGRRAALFTLSNARVLLLEAAASCVSALGLGVTDAHSCSAELTLSALADHPAALGASALWELSKANTRGLTLQLVERAASALPAANSFSAEQVEALDHVVIRSADMDQAVSFYGGTLGLRLALDRELGGTRMLFFRTGGVTLEVIADASTADSFYGVAYRVRDLQAAHLRLTAAGMALTDIRPGRKAGTQVFSTRSSQAVVPTLFIRDPSRD